MNFCNKCLVPLFPCLFCQCSLLYFANVPLLPQSPGRPSLLGSSFSYFWVQASQRKNWGRLKHLQVNPNPYIFINFYIFACLLLQEDTLEETGWKLVHGDVFRPPQRAWLLTAFVGSGVQIFCMVVITLGGCWFEILNLSWFVMFGVTPKRKVLNDF